MNPDKIDETSDPNKAPSSYGRGKLRSRIESPNGVWSKLSPGKKAYFNNLFNAAGGSLEQFLDILEDKDLVEDDGQVEEMTRKIVVILGELAMEWNENKVLVPAKSNEYKSEIKKMWDSI